MEEPLRVYRQRWAVLVSVTLLNISNAGLWINIAPVAYTAATFYGVTLAAVNWFSVVFMIVSIPFCFISTFIVDQLGLRKAILIGSTFNCAGSIVRAVGSSLFFPADARYPVSLAGQVVAGMGQAFILFIPTKVSQLWFPDDARAMATTVLAMSNPLGILITQVLSPVMVQTEDQIPLLNYVFCALAVVTQVVTLACVTRSKPPTPPSRSVALSELQRPPYVQQLKQTFTSLPYMLLLLALGCGVAMFTALATVTQQILCTVGYSQEFSGLAVAVMILCGFVGSAVTGISADRTKAFTPITKLCYGLACVFAIIMLELYLVEGRPALVATFTGIFGFFGVGAYPIGLELAVEATYPVEESISTAFIFLSGQVQGVVIIAMVTLLSRTLKPENEAVEVCTKNLDTDIEPRDYTVSVMAMMCLVTFAVVLIIAFFDTPYKRLLAERAASSTSSSSPPAADPPEAHRALTTTPSSTPSRESTPERKDDVVQIHS